MHHYTAIQWLFFFYFYCFFGWVFESTYVSIKSRHFVNRGFMRGPFLPIYGSGAIMMLVVSMPFQDNLILTYLAGCVGATLLELVTGMTMEALFKVRYWDYSNQKFNYKGHICLSSTIAWGFLTIFMTQFLHKGVEKLVLSIPYNILTILTVVLSVYIVADFTLSFKAAMDLRDVLIGLDKARAEMEKIQKRLDVLIAVVNDERETRKLEREERADEWMENLEERFSKVREHLTTNPGAFMDNVKDELAELRSKYLVEKEHRLQFDRLKDFYQRSLIKGNPGMYSRKFNEALEELKKAVNERKSK
ncbi:putative ABC transporter permease [Suilimivivens sp.]|uniref:putative ABC transporter permease n=1 Tax=Suilimivivens sp. TaxID=2981669 RepID=UPI00307B8C09